MSVTRGSEQLKPGFVQNGSARLEEGRKGGMGPQGRRKGRAKGTALQATQAILISPHSPPIRTKVWFSKSKTSRRVRESLEDIDSMTFAGKVRQNAIQISPFPRPARPWPVYVTLLWHWGWRRAYLICCTNLQIG